MIVRKNEAAIGAVIAADVRGVSRTAMKPLFINRNTFDVAPDQPVFRILPLDYLIQDIECAKFTHTRISARTWGDILENPLLNRPFPDVETGATFTLNGVVRDMFGSCWSLSPLDTIGDWDTFSRGTPSVRVESTAKRLLSAVMDVTNPHFDIHHAIGTVQYLTDHELDTYFHDPNFEKHLDGLGHGIHLSLMRLGTKFQSEDEVRLVCNFMPGEPWVRKNMRLEGDLLRVPALWKDAIRGVVIGPLVQSGGQQLIDQKLRELGIDCPVTSSPTRSHTG
jgi:hypothetical protein